MPGDSECGAGTDVAIRTGHGCGMENKECMTMDLIKKSFDDARQVLEAFMADGEKLDEVRRAGDLLVDMYRRGGKVFSCGNGGSLCDAMHFAEELTGRFRRDRDALPALAIADPSHLTCVANDMGYEEGFARYVKALGKPGAGDWPDGKRWRAIEGVVRCGRRCALEWLFRPHPGNTYQDYSYMDRIHRASAFSGKIILIKNN